MFAARPISFALLGVALLHGLVLFVLAPISLPTISHDSLGYLAAARWLAGVGETPQHVGVYYSFAYGGLLAPFYALGLGGAGVTAVASLINLLAGALLVLPLAAIVSRVAGVARAGAAVAAAAGALYAGVSLQVAEPWPEVLLALGTAVWMLLVVRSARSASPRLLAGLAAVALALFALHHRTIPLLGLTAVEIGIVARSQRWPLRWVGAGALAGVAAVAALLVVDEAAQQALFPLGADQQPILDLAAMPGLGSVLSVLVGELFYVTAGTFGLVAFGGWALWRAGAGELLRPAVYLAVALGAGALIGAFQLAGAIDSGLFQPSHMRQYATYGRYVDPYLPLLVALGAGVLLNGLPRPPALAALLATAASAALFMAVGLPWQEASYAPAVMPALTGFDALGAPPSLAVVVLASLLGAWLIGLQPRRAPRAGAWLAVALLTTTTLLAARDVFGPWREVQDAASADIASTLAGYPPDRSVAVLLRTGPGPRDLKPEAVLHRVQFLDPARHVLPLDQMADVPASGVDLVIVPRSERRSRGLPRRGDHRILIDDLVVHQAGAHQALKRGQTRFTHPCFIRACFSRRLMVAGLQLSSAAISRTP